MATTAYEAGKRVKKYGGLVLDAAGNYGNPATALATGINRAATAIAPTTQSFARGLVGLPQMPATSAPIIGTPVVPQMAVPAADTRTWTQRLGIDDTTGLPLVSNEVPVAAASSVAPAVQTLPAMQEYTPMAPTDNNIRPDLVNPLDPNYRKAVSASSPFTNDFGEVRRGSWDDLWNNKLIGVRAKNENAANVSAFEAGTGYTNAGANVKQANDAPITAANRVAADLAANAATVAASRENAQGTVAAARETSAAEIAGREQVANIGAGAINKNVMIRQIGARETSAGMVIPEFAQFDAEGNMTRFTPSNVGANLPPAGHIAGLKQNPTAAHKADFDKLYGAGAADKYLGK